MEKRLGLRDLQERTFRNKSDEVSQVAVTNGMPPNA
jgi:hypothetical protein